MNFSRIKDISKSKNIKNASWIIAEQVYQMILSLVLSVISARYLGPAQYGELQYTASFIVFFTSITTLGMEGVVIKKMVAYPQKEGLYLGSCMAFRFVSSIFSSIAILLIVFFLNVGDSVKFILAALQTLQLIARAFLLFDSWFQRHLKSKFVSIAKVIASTTVAIYKIYLLVSTKSVEWFAFSTSFDIILISCFLYFFYKREGGQPLRFSFNVGMEVLSESYHFIISGLMVATFGQMDKIMIGKMLSDASVGYYVTAASICSMWVFIPIAIINSFQPSIMELKKNGQENLYLRRLEQLYSLIIWVSMLFSILITLTSSLIVQILFGEAYMGAVEPLRIIIWSETFSMIGTARGIWVLCEDKNKYVKYYLAWGVIVNLALNFMLIPLWGINGAAFATLVTQFVTSLIAPILYKNTRIHTKYVLDAFLFKWHKA